MALSDHDYSETLVNSWSQDMQSATRSVRNLLVALKIHKKQLAGTSQGTEVQLTATQINKLKLVLDDLLNTAVPIQQSFAELSSMPQN